jgi:hypothetical protein
MHDRIKLARSQAQFSRLLGLCERQRQELESNPGPFIDRAYTELSKTRQLLADLRWVLAGGPEMMHSVDTHRPIRFESVLIERHRNAMELIRRFESAPEAEA